MLNTSTNNNHPSIISANTQSVNNLENSSSKKRSRHDLQYDNEDDYSAKDFNLISVNDDSISTSKNNRRKGIYGSNESTNFKTGTVPFNVYVGNVHLDTKDEEVSQLFNNNTQNQLGCTKCLFQALLPIVFISNSSNSKKAQKKISFYIFIKF